MENAMYNRRRKVSRGGSTLEIAFLFPVFVFLFVGAFDWGYYAHALISTEAAARTVANFASTNSTDATDSTSACTLALQELRIVPNVTSSTTCGSGSPVTVTTTLVGSGQTNTNSSYGGDNAAVVSVQYTTTQLIPIPGLLTNQMTFYRTVEM